MPGPGALISSRAPTKGYVQTRARARARLRAVSPLRDTCELKTDLRASTKATAVWWKCCRKITILIAFTGVWKKQ